MENNLKQTIVNNIRVNKMAKQKRKKEKNLKPSFREKKRYLLLGIDSNKKNREKVYDSILNYVGELGFAKASPQFVKNKDNILAVNREQVDEVKAALELVDIEVNKVSGTLEKIN